MFCRAKKINTIKFRDVFVPGWGWGKRMEKNCARLMIRAAAAIFIYFVVSNKETFICILLVEVQRAKDVEN